jgi:hypothetical protein
LEEESKDEPPAKQNEAVAPDLNDELTNEVIIVLFYQFKD